jgi:ketosteroid isomerase-like protein
MNTRASVGKPDVAALVTRLYDLEMSRDLESWMDMWDDSFVITFPFATDAARVPIRGKENLRQGQIAKFVERSRIELGVTVLPLADPLKALVYLDVHHTLAAGGERHVPVLCVIAFNNAGRIVAMEEFFNEAAVG